MLITFVLTSTLFFGSIHGQCTTEETYKDDRRPGSCLELQQYGYTTSGIYTVYYWEGNVIVPVRVYCDMETAGGGWLVFQRRRDGTEDFYRTWDDYRQGFGDLEAEFWLGNHFLSALTSSRDVMLRVDLGDFEGETRYAEYAEFKVASAHDNFRLHLQGYNTSSSAGDAFNVTVASLLSRKVTVIAHDNAFTTRDRDNDDASENCAVRFRGAWWYHACHGANLNGKYLTGRHVTYADGVNWYPWRGYYYSLKTSEMKFKPRSLSKYIGKNIR